MKIALFCAAAGVAMIAANANAVTVASVPVFGNTSAAQLIGTIAAGQSYSVTAFGTVLLCSTCNGGNPLVFNPNGTVATLAVAPYTPFNSGPQDHDPSVMMGSSGYYGFYGPGVNFGALYGSFTATPTSLSDLFLIGNGLTIAAGTARTLYGVVNDSVYTDNPATSFAVSLIPSAGPVPEPASWLMMIAGFGLAGAALRQRRRAVVSWS